MSQPFTFPPPPPPPPKPSQNQVSYQQPNARGGHRGRGGYPSSHQNTRGGNSGARNFSRGPHRGGGHGARGDSVNATSNGHSSFDRNETHQNTNSLPPSQNSRQGHTFNPAQKRPHSAAFNGQAQTKARPLAPPPVPSFGIDFNALLPKRPEPVALTNQPTKSALAKKTNLLGLTPALQVPGADSESESDAEEESKLADSMSADQNSLNFEYNGKAASLSTPEEIAAWIAERRKKWPTEAKRETARQQAEERRSKYEIERAARVEANRAAAKERQVEREKQKTEKEKSQLRQKMLQEQIAKAARHAKYKVADGRMKTPAQIKAEKLRLKAEKIAQKLLRAESALDKETGSVPPRSTIATEKQDPSNETQTRTHTDPDDIDSLLAQVDKIAAAQQDPSLTKTDLDTLNDDPDDQDDSDISSISSDGLDSQVNDPPEVADDTSTSGSSSDFDSDSEPEQLSSKQQASSSFNKPPPRQDTRPTCTNYAKTGRCKFGRRCHYRHEKVARDKNGGLAGRGGETGLRKGLYQIMVEKEVESERRRALRVIIGLGEGGWLNEMHDRDKDDEDGGVKV